MPLYAFGSNGSGQLGIGHVEDTSIPMECLFEELAEGGNNSGSENDIIQIATGGNHTLLRFRNGEVYAAGFNGDGRCGGTITGNANADADQLILQFRKVFIVEEIDMGTDTDVTEGNKKKDKEKRVWDRFALISATWEGSFLVSSSSTTIFAFGSGSKGELGLGPSIQSCRSAMRVPDFLPSSSSSESEGRTATTTTATASIIAIASSMSHTVVILDNGDVYGWGTSRKGQLGMSLAERKFVWSPTKIGEIPPFFRASDVTCGREFTVVCGDKGKGEFVILGAGGNRWGVLSGVPLPVSPGVQGTETGTKQVIKIFHFPQSYISILASWNGVYVHLADNRVVAWGRDDRGQLPPGDLRGGASLKKIAVGSEHGLALLGGDDDERTVVAFGWGEHGNCGTEIDERGNVRGRYNVVDIPFQGEKERVIGIAGGCATSWIITS